jgi:hypothetical protein
MPLTSIEIRMAIARMTATEESSDFSCFTSRAGSMGAIDEVVWLANVACWEFIESNPLLNLSLSVNQGELS